MSFDDILKKYRKQSYSERDRGAYANREVTLMFWEVGRYINAALLGKERAKYGKKIFVMLSRKSFCFAPQKTIEVFFLECYFSH